MAFFERDEERDKLIVCNICNCECAERSIITHRSNCRQNPLYSGKFESGVLLRCDHDSSHASSRQSMDSHLEFCAKRQSLLVSEFQEAFKVSNSDFELPEFRLSYREHPLTDDAWNRDADSENFIAKMGSLNI